MPITSGFRAPHNGHILPYRVLNQPLSLNIQTTLSTHHLSCVVANFLNYASELSINLSHNNTDSLRANNFRYASSISLNLIHKS